jgi:lipopolysaccharide transport system permease protein
MLVYTVFVGIVLDVPSDGLPYPIFAFSALLPWNLFSQTVLRASESLVSQTNLVSKVYVPRLLLPVAVAGSFLLDFLISVVVLAALMVYYSFAPTAKMLSLPLLTLLALTAAIAVGVFCAAMNVKYRDVRAVVPLLMQVWFFATPVAYPASLVPEAWQPVYALNPMVGVVEGFRWAVLPTGSAPVGLMTISAAASVVLLVLSLFYFRRVDRTFADVI